MSTDQNNHADSAYDALLEAIQEQQMIWILKDDEGFVVLADGDQDCIPVWSSEDQAQAWANGDWKNCVAKSISLKKWLGRWTSGLSEDGIDVAVLPDIDGDSMVLSSKEFANDLQDDGAE
jgi:hypothetical protein